MTIVQMPMMTRSFQVRSESLNEKEHTFVAVLTTSAPVRRYDWNRNEYYDEVLEISKAAIDPQRIDGTLPLLDSHNRWAGTDGIRGRTGDWWIEGNKLLANVRVDVSDDKGKRLWGQIQGGFVKDISIGYNILKAENEYAEAEDGTRGLRTMRGTLWSPHESSVVPIPADADANIRSEGGQHPGEPGPETRTFPCEMITRSGEETMTNKKKSTPAAGGNPAAEPTAEERAAQEAGTAGSGSPAAEVPAAPAAPASEERSSEASCDAMLIMQRCDEQGLDLEYARGLIAEGLDTQASLARLMDHLASERGSHSGTVATTPNAEADRDQRREAMGDALLWRAQPEESSGDYELPVAAQRYAHMSIIDMARHALGREAELWSPTRVLEKALHSTSDFVLALANVQNKVLRKAFEEEPQTWRVFSNQRTVKDFKQVVRLQTGDFPDLAKVNEHGEFRSGTFSEIQEAYQIAAYGVIVGFTRQAMINDDLDSLTRVVQSSGRAAARLEGDIMWGLVTGNGNMADGNAIFSAAHKNLATVVGKPTEATLAHARKLMRLQKTLDNKRMNIVAKYIAVAAEDEIVTQKLLTAVVANNTGDVNVFNGKYKIIVESRLDDVANFPWYMFADKGRIDMLEHAYLGGQSRPVTSQKVGFNTDGIQYKIRHDFGGGVIEHRGMLKNPAV